MTKSERTSRTYIDYLLNPLTKKNWQREERKRLLLDIAVFTLALIVGYGVLIVFLAQA